MIDWDMTKSILNRNDLSGIKPKVVVRCDKCNDITKIITIRIKKIVVDNQLKWRCRKCLVVDPQYKQMLKNRWTDEFRARASNRARAQWTDEHRSYMSKIGKEQWTDEYRSYMRENYYDNPDFIDKLRKIQEKYKKSKSLFAKNQWNNIEYRNKRIKQISDSSKKLWKDPVYRDKISKSLILKYTSQFIENCRQNTKSLWANKDYYESTIAAIRNEDNRKRLSENAKELWLNSDYKANQINIIKDRWNDQDKRNKMAVKFTPEVRLKLSESATKLWQDTEYKTKMLLSIKPVSSLQEILYSILDDLGIKYYREYNDKPSDIECFIGPYSFDCVIPRKDRPTLLIECQGEYWHNTKSAILKDTQKSSYINNNFSGKYEIKYLWEHEFKCKDKIIETIKYWTGATTEQINFNFDEITIKECLAADYKPLLSKYHYIGIGRGGITYGAYLKDKLIAVCSFSPIIRQNIKQKNESSRELSRFCIHPSYQKKNFGSWFISKCIKILPKQYKTIISYCDTTFNHDGALYKACNFILDKIVPADYWYTSSDGWVIHKKTLYNHAKKMKKTESEYATENGYIKTFGFEKHKYIFER